MGPRRLVPSLVVVAIAPALGCMVPVSPRRSTAAQGQNAGVPSWAKHVKAAPVSDRETFNETAAAVVDELGRGQLADFHLPPEQMAFAAMQSLEAGHRADAALLLAIASYRYRQEAEHALDVGYALPPSISSQVNGSAYFQLVHAEQQTYQHLGFEDEQRIVAAWLRGEDALDLDADLVRRLADLYREPSVDEETFREALRQRLPTATDAGNETPEGAALADAFLARLRADAGGKRKTVLDADWAMAHTPLPAFQLEALRRARLPLAPRFCAGIADQLGAHRAAVEAMLEDKNDGTRAAAAVVLGMSPSPDQLPMLNRALDAERQPLVRLAVAYALARHGRHERVQDLVVALENCKGDTCQQAIALLECLPREIVTNVSEEVPAALAGDGSKTWAAHLFAAALLGRMALEHPLSARARAALFALSHDKHQEMSRVAREAIGRDAGLPRSEVVARLAAASPDYRPLLARLARVATADDLALAARLMPRFAASDGPEAGFLIEAVGAVPGPEADGHLLAWFDNYWPLRAQLALRLLRRRPSSDRALDHAFAVGSARIRLLVELARGAPNAQGALDLALRSADPNERLFAARLAGTVGDPRSTSGLWRLVNFHDDRYYPQDALLRHEAMTALLRIALGRHRPPPHPRKTMAEVGSPAVAGKGG